MEQDYQQNQQNTQSGQDILQSQEEPQNTTPQRENFSIDPPQGEEMPGNVGGSMEQQQHFRSDSRSRSSHSSSRSNSSSHSRSNSHMSHSSSGSKYDKRPKDPNFLQKNSPNITAANPNMKPPQLDFLIFLSKALQIVLTEKKILHEIETQIGDVKMEFDPTFIIPEYNGCLLKIKGPNLKKKRDAAQQLLEFIVQNNLDDPGKEAKKLDKIAIVIMIPNGLVSMVIGTRGKQISNLIKDSKASIVINQPIYKMTYRTVSISGRPSNVSNAIMNIQRIMEDRYNEVAKIEFECRPLNVTRTPTNVKLIFSIDVVDRISGKKHSFIDHLQEEFDVSTKIYQDRKNRQLDRKDYICSLKGTIEHVQNAILAITRKIRVDIRTPFDGKESYTMKMLINKIFVTKLIGAGGCMIQEIANFSKGASIKIMSNKHDEKKSSCHDIPVCIAGSFSSVQDACCIIIEQMECFKNGGPVLKSGKNLHQNIANQFINSIFTNAVHEESEDEHIYTIKDRFMSNKEIQSHPQDFPIPQPQKFQKERSRSRHRRKSRSMSKSSRSRSWSRSQSQSRSFSRHNHDDSRYRKKEIQKRSSNYDNYTGTFSFEENGDIKINTDFIVPDHLVSLLIGKNGDNVRGIMNKTGATITFSKEYNDECKLNTPNGIGRICNLKGTPRQNANAMQMILELVIKFENIFNEKKEK